MIPIANKAILLWSAMVAPIALPLPLGNIMPPDIFNSFEQDTSINEVMHGVIVYYNNKKFLCGRAKIKEVFPRYIFSLELDWQFIEPPPDDDTWGDWDSVYEKICKGKE